MIHPNVDVERALLILNDALCSWERATDRQSILILREDGGFVHRTANGKLGIPDSVPDNELLKRFE